MHVSTGVLNYGCATLNKTLPFLPRSRLPRSPGRAVVRFAAQAAGAALIAGAGPAPAADWSLVAGLSSDYRVRGVSVSQGHAAQTLDLNYRGDTGWAAGFGAGRLGPDRRSLLSASLGHGWQLDGDWRLALDASRTDYPGSRYRPRYTLQEVAASLNWQGRVTATLMVSPHTRFVDGDGNLRSGRAYSAELGWRQRLAGPVALDLGVGHYRLAAPGGEGHADGYGYGSVGLSAALGAAQAYLSYAGASGRPALAWGGAGWVGTLLWQF